MIVRLTMMEQSRVRIRSPPQIPSVLTVGCHLDDTVTASWPLRDLKDVYKN
jgi:hypothetical protein